jgi:DHA3 family macrolide efflux protein-like MFS transporter
MWAGQSVSLLGSAMSTFALGIWLFQETGLATPLALTALAGFLPGILAGPFAGALVDRIDRKTAMIFSDTVQGAASLALLLLLAAGRLEPLALYLLLAVGSAAGSLQYPAEAATVSLLVPREQLGRANGLLAMSDGLSNLLAPLLAAALLPFIGVEGVLLIDLLTFAFAVIVLLFLRIPRPAVSAIGASERGSLWREARGGWRYIVARPGLLGLLLVFAGINLTMSLTGVLITPLLLARTGNDSVVVGTVFSAFGLGGLIGAAIMTATGGPRPRVHGVFASIALAGVFGQALFGLANSTPLWLVCALLNGLLLPIMNGSSQAIWQAKVEADLQGRVFAVRRVIAQFTAPIGFLASGALADNVFGPLMRGPVGESLAPLLGPVEGRGIAAMFLIAGVLTLLDGLSGYLRPRARLVEREVPDASLATAA